MAAPDAETWETISVYGLKVAGLIFGVLGSVLAIANTPPLTARQSWAAFISGVACSVLMPDLVVIGVHSWFGYTLPGKLVHALAFFFGIGGIFIVPGIIVLWRGFATDPLSWWDNIIARLPRRSAGDDQKRGGGQ